MIARHNAGTGKGEKAASLVPASRKEKALFTGAELAQFRKMLQEKRRSLLGDINGIETDADDATGLLASEVDLLRQIDEALARIEDGTYGRCQATGVPISKARLEACPWARYCIEYARQDERTRARAARRQAQAASGWGDLGDDS